MSEAAEDEVGHGPCSCVLLGGRGQNFDEEFNPTKTFPHQKHHHPFDPSRSFPQPPTITPLYNFHFLNTSVNITMSETLVGINGFGRIGRIVFRNAYVPLLSVLP